MTEDNRSQTADTCPEDKTMEPVKRDMDALAGEPAATAGQDPGEAGTNAPAEKTKAAAAAGKRWTGDPEQLYHAINTVKDAVNHIQEIKEAAKGWPDVKEIDGLMKELESLEPYILQELEQYPEYKNLSFQEFLEGFTLFQFLDLANSDSNIAEILNKARAASDINAKDEKRAKYTRAQIQSTENIEYPVDKPNNNFWDNAWRLLTESPDGQYTFSFNMAGKGRKEELPLYLSINFEALQDIHITKKLTPFDKRVYIAVSALFNAGNDVITLSQIYRHMGYKGRPGAKDLKRIHECIVKMMGAQISVDNELEANTYKKYGHFTYRGVLLPVEIGELYDVQGALTDAAIHILREPPLMTFARQRDQLTTVSLKLLQSPVNKTDANLAIDDYLIVQIKRAQKGKQHGRHRMLFKTIYKNTGIPEKPKTNTEKSARQRAPGKIKKFLTHYQDEGTINNYTVEKDGITVYW